MRLPEPGELEAAIAAIISRRARYDDDAVADDPLSVLRHVRSHRRVPRHILTADAADALTLARCLSAAVDEEKYATITMARAVGMTWAQIASRLGLESPQGAQQLHDRLESLRAGGPRSEVAARRARHGQVGEEAWLLRHERRILRVARAVAAGMTDRWWSEDAAEEGDMLTEKLQDPATDTRVVMSRLSLLAKEWEALPDPPDSAALMEALELAGHWRALS